MVKIFSGDDTDFRDDQRLALSFSAPEVDFSGCSAELEFLGQKRTFADVASGAKLAFSFSADETRGMACGVWPVTIRLRDASGRVRTVDNTQRIKVTNDVNEAYADAEQELSVVLVPGGSTGGGAALPELPADLSAVAEDSVGDFKAKFNRLLELLRGAACLAVLLISPLAAVAATPLYGPLNDLPGTAQIMTNTADYIEDTLYEWERAGIDARRAMSLGSWGPTVGFLSWGFSWDANEQRWVSSWTDNFFESHRETVSYLSDVTNIVREASGTVWDDALGVAWEARMHNGHLYYIAVTNKQETAE